jgi:hypothetical protein
MRKVVKRQSAFAKERLSAVRGVVAAGRVAAESDNLLPYLSVRCYCSIEQLARGMSVNDVAGDDSLVEWTSHSYTRRVKHMRINHRHAHILVP